MDRVTPSAGFIDQLPDFCCSSFWFSEDAVCDICEPESVDSPFPISAFKPETSVDFACVCGEVEIHKGGRNGTIS